MKCEQSWLIPLTMKLIVTVPPILFIILGLPFLWKYPITEKTREKVKNLLMEKRYRSVLHVVQHIFQDVVYYVHINDKLLFREG